MANICGKLVNNKYYKIKNEDFISFINSVIDAHLNWVDTLEDMSNSLSVKPIQVDGKKVNKFFKVKI